MYSTLNYCIIIFFAWDICSPNNSAFFYIFAAWPAFGFFFNAGYELGTAALRMYIAVWCATIYVLYSGVRFVNRICTSSEKNIIG